MATTLSSNASSPNTPSGVTPISGARRSSVASLRTVGNTALQPDLDADVLSTGPSPSLILSNMPRKGAASSLAASANDRFYNQSNIVSFPTLDSTSPHLLTAADFSTGRYTAADVDAAYAKAHVAPTSEQGYDEWLAKYFSKKHDFIQADNDDLPEDKTPFMPGGDWVEDMDFNSSGRRSHRPIKIREETEEEKKKREEEEKKEEEEAKKKQEEEAKKKNGDEAKNKDGKPGEKTGDHVDGEGPHAGEGVGGDAAASRDATAGVRDAAVGTRDATAGVRDAAVGTRDVTAGVRDATIGARDAAVVARDVAGLSRTVVEGAAVSRFALIGGSLAVGALALAGSLAIGTALFMVGTAAVVGLGAAAIVGYVTGSKEAALRSGLKMAGEMLVPSEAREAFSQGHIFKGLDLTLGISSTLHMVGAVAEAGWDAIKHPAAAWESIKNFTNKVVNGVGLVGAAVADSNTRQDVLRLASGLATGDGTATKATSDLAHDSMKNETIKTRLKALMPNLYNTLSFFMGDDNNAPAPTTNGTTSGGRRRDHIVMDAKEPVRPTNLATNGILPAPHPT